MIKNEPKLRQENEKHSIYWMQMLCICWLLQGIESFLLKNIKLCHHFLPPITPDKNRRIIYMPIEKILKTLFLFFKKKFRNLIGLFFKLTSVILEFSNSLLKDKSVICSFSYFSQFLDSSGNCVDNGFSCRYIQRQYFLYRSGCIIRFLSLSVM